MHHAARMRKGKSFQQLIQQALPHEITQASAFRLKAHTNAFCMRQSAYLDQCWIERAQLVFHKALQVLVDVFKDEKELAILLQAVEQAARSHSKAKHTHTISITRSCHTTQLATRQHARTHAPDNVGVLKLPQHGDLA